MTLECIELMEKFTRRTWISLNSRHKQKRTFQETPREVVGGSAKKEREGGGSRKKNYMSSCSEWVKLLTSHRRHRWLILPSLRCCTWGLCKVFYIYSFLSSPSQSFNFAVTSVYLRTTIEVGKGSFFPFFLCDRLVSAVCLPVYNL